MAKTTICFKTAPLSKKREALLKDLEMLGDYFNLRGVITDFNRLVRTYSREVQTHRTRTKPGHLAARTVVQKLWADGKGMSRQEFAMFRVLLERDEARKAKVPQNFLRRIVGKMLRDYRKAQKAVAMGKPPTRKIQLEPLSDIQAVKILSFRKRERKPITSNRICRG